MWRAGTEGHSIGLAKLGYKVTGLDLSSYFLGIAKEHARNEGVQVNWVKGDMRDIKFKGEFDAAIICFTAFGLFESEEDNADVIKRIARALKPRGKFIIDYVNRDFIIRHYLAKDRQKLDDGWEKIVERKFDHLWGGHEERVILRGKGKKREFTIRFRFFSLMEIAAMIRNAGMRILKVYGAFDYSKLDFDSRRCIIVSKKEK